MPDIPGLCHVEHVMGTAFPFDIRDQPTPAIRRALAEAVTASQPLHDAGARHTCSNGGGDLQPRGQADPGRAWRIGTAHPFRPGELVTVITASRGLAVATSGTAERGHHIVDPHIVDPHTGRPADTFASLTLVGPGLTLRTPPQRSPGGSRHRDGWKRWTVTKHRRCCPAAGNGEPRDSAASGREERHDVIPARRQRAPPLVVAVGHLADSGARLVPVHDPPPSEGSPLWDST
ncbi:FAD:protein FMN transferase [Streptomyces scabiei]|uniref:FAD:protein FMN transferase n=1 Tax=Streptomyces scabiei TaxID=1930 RepID=UPI00298FC11A|nr:FAD:protein FMN transferase [Streptomyces scabiei]